MRRSVWRYATVTSVVFPLLYGCAPDHSADIQAVLSQPKQYVGSEVCQSCHLEHHDAWMKTLHSRMLQDARANVDAIVAPLDEKKIRADLATLGDKLKVPADQIFVPRVDEVLYTIGSQFKQRYMVEREGTLYIAPVQYNADTNRWVNYHENDWDKRPWIQKCGGCHATGVDIEKGTFVEPGVGCEACHGKGSWHVATPVTDVNGKRRTIVNPGKLTSGVAVEICGSCHNRGKSLMHEKASWAVGYEPGKALEAYFESTSFAKGDKKYLFSNEFSKAHHQQYMDWKLSKHAEEGVTCTACHFVHELGAGAAATRTQTKLAGSKQCLECHQLINQNGPHAIHSFGNCVGCHMPRIVKNAETGDQHSHVFAVLLPRDTLADPNMPNSCQTCHYHAEHDLEDLQRRYDELSQRRGPAEAPQIKVEMPARTAAADYAQP